MNGPPIAIELTEKAQEDVLLFVSYDIVGSTKFKNKDDNWAKKIKQCINELRGAVENLEDVPPLRLWKALGDELVFICTISTIKDLKSVLPSLFDVLQSQAEILSQDKLDLKATAWLACVEEHEKAINTPLLFTVDDIKDYIGRSIDEGFRLAHQFARPRRFVVSFEIASLLLDPKEHPEFMKSFYLVGMEKLKGVWREEYYPAIWYHKVVEDQLFRKMAAEPYKFPQQYHYNFSCKLSENFFKVYDRNWGAHVIEPDSELSEILENIRDSVDLARDHYDLLKRMLK